MKRRVGGWVLAAATALLLSGCFGYLPAELGSVPAGEEIRVHLAAQGQGDVAALSGGTGTTLAGRLVWARADSIRVRVPVGAIVEGSTTRTLGQDIDIPRTDVTQVERRELNRPRTVIAVVGGVALLVSAVLAYGEINPNPELPPEDVPEELGGRGARTMPILRLGVP